MTIVRGGLVYPLEAAPHAELLEPSATTQLVDWAVGPVQVLDLTTASGNVTVSFANPTDGGVYHLVVVRDTGGNDVSAWPSNVRWPGGTAPKLQDSTSGRIYDAVHFVYQATDDVYVARDLSAAEAYVAVKAIDTPQLMDGAVTDAKLRDSAATSVIGRAAGTSGDPADIVASADRRYLGRRAGALGFHALELADLPQSAATGSVDFGTSGRVDYAEATLTVPWGATPVVIAGVRGGTSDHPLADEDAAIEELKAVVIAQGATSVTVGVHAPNGTWGTYVVTVIAGGAA